MSSAYVKLTGRRLRWHKAHALVRERLRGALVDRIRGDAQAHVAQGVLDALDPDGPRAVDLQVDLRRRQAAGMELKLRATRVGAFMRKQVARTARHLHDA